MNNPLRQIVKLCLLFSICVYCSIFFSGCAGSGRLKKYPEANQFLDSLNTWPKKYRQNFEAIRTFYGKASLAIESENYNGTVSLETNWQSPDKLLLKAEGPLGWDVGEIFVGNSRFVWYNQYQNQFISGSIDDPYLNSFMQTNITFKDLKYASLGYAVNRGDDPPSLVDNIHGVFSAEIDGLHYTYLVNPGSGLLESLEISRDERTFVKQQFKNYRVIEGIYIPMIVQITMLDQQERITIFYKDIHINRPIEPQKFVITVNPKVEQLNLN